MSETIRGVVKHQGKLFDITASIDGQQLVVTIPKDMNLDSILSIAHIKVLKEKSEDQAKRRRLAQLQTTLDVLVKIMYMEKDNENIEAFSEVHKCYVLRRLEWETLAHCNYKCPDIDNYAKENNIGTSTDNSIWD